MLASPTQTFRHFSSEMKCPYCSAGPSQGRCTTAAAGRSITECTSCGRVIEERQTQTHHMFHLRAQDSPLLLSTSDLPPPPPPTSADPDDPFEHTGFITAFSTWSLEHCPLFALSSLSFSGHLAELERTLESSNSGNPNPNGGVVVDNLRAYLQIVDVASILGLEHDISDHAFQLFRDCSSATFLRNRSVEALATACLVQAIREAQEPRTLQEISIAANLPQKEIGKYIKILGEALQLSQPINSNSIAVHMPRFCNLLQLNKSAQELATHIGEVVMNKCFCTRRNPISISAAAIYLACQLEDRRKTQAEICKVTGLTEVTLRKVYKELLENWDDLLPSNYTPVVPPEKAFPTTTIASGRSTGPRAELPDTAVTDREKQPESKPHRTNQVVEMNHQDRGRGESEGKGSVPNASKTPTSWKSGTPFGTNAAKTSRENQNANHGIGLTKSSPTTQEMEHKVPGSVAYHDRGKGETESKASIPASKAPTSWKTGVPCGADSVKTSGESQILNQGIGLNKSSPSTQELEQKAAGAMTHPDRGRGETQARSSAPFTHKATTSWRPGLPFTPTSFNPSGVIPSPNPNQGISVNLKKSSPGTQEAEQKVFGSMRSNPFVAAKVFGASSTVGPPLTSSPLPHVQSSQPGQYQTTSASSEVKGTGKYNEGKGSDPDRTR